MSLSPLFHASPVIQLHALIAIAALLLGAVQLWRTKGDRLHRALGRVWVALMATVAGSGLFIWTIRLWGRFSPIHRLSLLVLVMLWRGVRAAVPGGHGDIQPDGLRDDPGGVRDRADRTPKGGDTAGNGVRVEAA